MSDSDEDNVIRYGTPLEPFDEEEVPSKKKFQPKATDQYAVDDHGRRRFHGAFTGGFSAGHGNTVGTPDGFTPATFKSSRKDKAHTSKSQRPEDYMDEEDRSEFGIAPRFMQTQSDFSGQKRPHQQRFQDGPIPGDPVLEQILQTVHETAAVRILKAQGWRPGQGAGVRLTAGDKAKRKVYGCYIPGQSTAPQPAESDSDTSIDYDTLYAPDDYEPCASRVKSDRFGLGYSGLSRHSVLGLGVAGEGGRSHLQLSDKGRKVSIRGQAFGVGALEEDDEDIYAGEDMSHYDFALGGERREEKKQRVQESGVLQGFVKATMQLPPTAAYPPPALPRDYVPCVAGARRSRFEATVATPRDQGLGRHELTAQARGALLGETPILKPIEPTETTDPIAKLLGRNVNFVSTSNVVDATSKETTQKGIDYIPISNTNEPAVKVFKPFASNPAKQLRYEKYVQNGVLEEDGGDGKLAAWERNRELMEFDQAAKLYKPLSGIMGERFTHASQPDERPTDPLAAVARTARDAYSPAAAAAAGLHGAATRHAAPWRPEALVCKRFNVPDPSGTRSEPQKEDRPKVSYSIFSYMESSVHDKESFTKEQTKFSGSMSVSDPIPTPSTSKICEPAPKKDIAPSTDEAKDTNVNKRLTVAELFMRESEKDLKQSQTKDVNETIEKFDKMELYKAIFLSDSEDEDPAKTEETPKIVTDYNEFTDVPKNIGRNRSPPRGIFANIDFDELNSWKRTEPKEVETILEVKPIDEANLYGPKVPEGMIKRLQETIDSKQVTDKNEVFRPSFRRKSDRDKGIEVVDSSSSEDSWVEAKDKTKKSKKKKSKKSKSKHRKSKHKKKDR